MSRSLMDLHDVELAALAAAGGRREFGELARRHGSAVRYLLRRMGAQPAEADDIAQDAFLTAFQRCGEFRGEGTFGAWVKRIAARLYLKRRAKDARYVEETAVDEAAPAVDHGGLMDLDEALKTLVPVERLCVSLSHGAGMSHPEIAAAMNLPLGTVKSHVKRGLDKLRARLAPERIEDGGLSMSSDEFDADIERLFARSPQMPDADVFASNVRERLNSGSRFRTVALAAAGLIGGVFAVKESADFTLNLSGSGGTVGARSVEAAGVGAGDLAQSVVGQWDLLDLSFLGSTGGMQLFWLVAGLLIAAAATGFVKLLQEA